jgi:hypothetical protein
MLTVLGHYFRVFDPCFGEKLSQHDGIADSVSAIEPLVEIRSYVAE